MHCWRCGACREASGMRCTACAETHRHRDSVSDFPLLNAWSRARARMWSYPGVRCLKSLCVCVCKLSSKFSNLQLSLEFVKCSLVLPLARLEWTVAGPGALQLYLSATGGCRMPPCARGSKSVPTRSYAMRASASAPGATGSPATHAISGRHARSGASRGRLSAFSSILLQACTHTCRMARPLGIFPVWFALSLPAATTFDSANLHNPKPNPNPNSAGLHTARVLREVTSYQRRRARSTLHSCTLLTLASCLLACASGCASFRLMLGLLRVTLT